MRKGLFELDEPLVDDAPPRSAAAVPTPVGDELVDPLDCEEPTWVMTSDELRPLLELSTRPDVAGT